MPAYPDTTDLPASLDLGHPDPVKAAEYLQSAEDLLGRNMLAEARSVALQAESVWPVATWLLLGRITLRQGDFVEAERILRQAVAQDGSEQAQILLIAALSGGGQTDEALARLNDLAAASHLTAQRLFQVGGLYENLEHYAPAARCFLRSLELDRTSARVWHRLGNARLLQNDTGGAIEAFQIACQMEPENIDFSIDLGTGFARAGRFEEALVIAQRALEQEPDNILALNNTGYALQCLNRSAEACRFYDHAAELAPDHAQIRFGRAIARLKSGDYPGGWPEFEWRWRSTQTMPTGFRAPLWCGENLAGRTLLLHGEQGFGDTIQFIRLASDLAKRGARVLAYVPPALARLVAQVDGVSEVFETWDHTTPIDFHCPLLNVPRWIALHPAASANAPYLRVPEDMQRRYGDPLRQKCRVGAERVDLVVGLVWSGDPRPHDLGAALTDSRRSLSLADFAPLMSVQGVRFVSFQFGAAREQIAGSGFPISDDAMDGVTDFLDSAARLSGIDLLISVDTSIVHLAGGLGLPVWMLSRLDGCWRWGDSGHQSDWYPLMRIMRQQRSLDWSAPIAEARECLEKVAAAYQVELHRRAEMS